MTVVTKSEARWENVAKMRTVNFIRTVFHYRNDHMARLSAYLLDNNAAYLPFPYTFNDLRSPYPGASLVWG
jgi:hypothetical protein